MTIEEIREARIKAQDEIRATLRKLADHTGLGVVGVHVQVLEGRPLGLRQVPEYVVADVRIELESP